MSNWKNLFPKENIFYETENGILYNGDCLEIMSKFPENVIDAIITDPPYGTTACNWDAVIPFENMWEKLKRIRKDITPILLFGIEPFSSLLRVSNLKEFRYDWIWKKEQGANFMNVKHQPYKVHEIISVFGKKYPNYFPIMEKGKPYISGKGTSGEITGNVVKIQTKNKGTRYPRSVIKFNTDKRKSVHPTQKPVALMEYLIKTYTNEGDLILDFTCGSGTTLVACEKLNRKWIGIEISKEYCEITKQRIEEEVKIKKNKLKNKLFE